MIDKFTVIMIVVMIIYSLLAGSIGYFIKDSTPPLIVYRDAECEEIAPQESLNEKDTNTQETKIDDSILVECESKLKNCWYAYSNDCNMDCVIPECEKCEDFGKERDGYLEEINSLLKSRDGCRISESNLSTELKACEQMLPHF